MVVKTNSETLVMRSPEALKRGAEKLHSLRLAVYQKIEIE